MKKKIVIALTLAFVLLSVSACSMNNTTADSSGDDTGITDEGTTDEQETQYDTVVIDDFKSLPQLEAPKTGDPVAVFHTNHGDVKVRLFPDYAPKAVENFTTHAREGYYNGLTFHRVINEFMIQGGDPNGNGTGGESIWGEPFENEVSLDLRNIRGALCMANAGPNTNGSQFYIVQNTQGAEMQSAIKGFNMDEPYINGTLEFKNKDGKTLTNGDVFPQEVIDAYVSGGYPYLDLGYTVFGQVYEGITIVDEIAAVQTENDKPVEDVIINSIDIGTY